MDPISSTLRPLDLVEALDAPALVDRDAATRRAIVMGRMLARKVINWPEGTDANRRARRGWTYTGMHLRAAEELDEKTFDFAHTGTVASALDAFAIRAGVLVAKDIACADVPISLALTGTTQLGVLDAIAAQAGCRVTQTRRGEPTTEAGEAIGYPTAYAGPMRVRVVGMQLVRATDFSSTTEVLRATLRVDWQWPYAPTAPIAISIANATCGEPTIAGKREAEVIVELDDAKRPRLVGNVGGLFDGAFSEVAVPVPGSITQHGVTITSTRGASGGCDLAINSPDGNTVSSVTLAISTTDEEAVPHVHTMRTFTERGIAERWLLRPRDGFGDIREVRVRIAAPARAATFSFALALPQI